jgi:hypothetical protein
MIDTIRFKVCNITNRYPWLLQRLKTYYGEKNYKEIHVTKEGYQTGRVLKKGTFFIKSSSRDINWKYDNVDNAVYFEFSVPKACYGTNVFQFVNHRTDLRQQFILSYAVEIENQLEILHGRISRFIRAFLHDISLHPVVSDAKARVLKMERDAISLYDIEVERVDMCYNRIFNSKADALLYLDLLRSVTKKGLRKVKSNAVQVYESSLYMVTKYFTFKVYHKGTEFFKTDRKGLIDINHAEGWRKYEIDDLQNFANRILRYEIEYKKTGLNYLYKQRIYKKGSASYKAFKKQHMEYEVLQRKLDRLAELKRLRNQAKLYLFCISVGSKSYDGAFKLIIDKMKPLRSGFLFVNKALGQHSRFKLEIFDYEREYNSTVTTDEYESYRSPSFHFEKNALFSSDLVKALGNHFQDFVKQFTLKTIPDQCLNSDVFISMYKQRNEEFKKNNLRFVSRNAGFFQFIKLLDTMSMDEIKQNGEFDRRTFYRYAERLREFGYFRESRLSRPIPCSKDFADYYMYVFGNSSFESNCKCNYFM